MINLYIKRFPHALRGIWFALRNDFGFRTQFYGIGLVAVAILTVTADISQQELLFVVLAYFLILITELQNSALEVALDKLHPELHDSIGKSKDMAAGAVLLAGIFLVIVIASLFY